MRNVLSRTLEELGKETTTVATADATTYIQWYIICSSLGQSKKSFSLGFKMSWDNPGVV